MPVASSFAMLSQQKRITGGGPETAVELAAARPADADAGGSLLGRIGAAVVAWLTSTAVLRFAFAVLRHLAPVLVVGKRAIVSRHADVIDLLRRDEEFTIAEINAARTDRDNGPFVLSMDRSAQHDREKALLVAAMQRDDVEAIRAFVVKEGTSLVDAARSTGRLEVVHGLSRVVPLRLIEHYFGIPPSTEPLMMHWLRTLFHDLFLNPGDDEAVIAAAVQSGHELRPHMLAVIARRRAAAGDAPSPPSDVLGRMIALQSDPDYAAWLDDDAICRNMGGLTIGALETTSKAVVLVLDELLRRPDALRGARAAAEAGDIEAVRGYAFEALRFNPFVPILLRHCAADALLGRGTHRERRIPAGTTVYAGTLSAMFDDAAFEAPGEFRPDRQVEYLHFGHGLHRCQGLLVNHVQVPELVAAVLRLDDLRRAPGDEGRVLYDGPFPDRFVLEFTPS